MPFSLESEMTRPVSIWLAKQRLLTKAEFELPWGVCDLVGLSFNKNHVRQRLALRQYRPIGPLKRVDLLCSIPEKESGVAVTLEGLRGVTASALTLESDVQRLIEDKFVVVDGCGNLQKRNGWAPLHRRIVAVELKRFRVSEALSQAVSNRAFATESYIALPKGTAERIAFGTRSTEFKEQGVGILSVSPSSCRLVLRSCEPIEHDVALQMHCVERFWRTRGSSTLAAVRCARAV